MKTFKTICFIWFGLFGFLIFFGLAAAIGSSVPTIASVDVALAGSEGESFQSLVSQDKLEPVE